MDPYKVLEVDRNASDEEIKKAYRELVKKYHPDKYTDAHMKELASEKLKQVNAAYDEIQRIRQNKSSQGNGSYSSYSSYSSNPRYASVRSKIQMGDLAGAESILDGMTDRDAEWHYLKGVILLRRGWYDGARQHFTNAHNMDPSNQEYAQAFNSLNNMGRGYTDYYGGGQNVGGCSVCDVCAGMMCADMCCSMGRCC